MNDLPREQSLAFTAARDVLQQILKLTDRQREQIALTYPDAMPPYRFSGDEVLFCYVVSVNGVEPLPTDSWVMVTVAHDMSGDPVIESILLRNQVGSPVFNYVPAFHSEALVENNQFLKPLAEALAAA